MNFWFLQVSRCSSNWHIIQKLRINPYHPAIRYTISLVCVTHTGELLLHGIRNINEFFPTSRWAPAFSRDDLLSARGRLGFVWRRERRSVLLFQSQWVFFVPLTEQVKVNSTVSLSPPPLFLVVSAGLQPCSDDFCHVYPPLSFS